MSEMISSLQLMGAMVLFCLSVLRAGLLGPATPDTPPA